ncbi:MAG: cell wall hydrolase [Bacteroidales bacterium]|nr:cell wall hydrolase [Lachnoclostridium sp.]MCM1383584.1 cell wall hydrolase [Lachnoclostridium sp.]MCM1464134.1 cell wall hydrolase [Bacteroidales bacterium]
MKMYKKAVTVLAAANFLCLCSFWNLRNLPQERLAAITVSVCEEKVDETQKNSLIGILKTAASGQRVVDYEVLVKESVIELNESDKETLCRIVEAEAGSEDADGKLLVANVVLNRVEDKHFPNTVREVVFQEEQGVYQFSPVADGNYDRVKVSQETRQAVERALEGEDISQGALYFAARQYADNSTMSWFDNHLSFLFAHGGHEFYTSP